LRFRGSGTILRPARNQPAGRISVADRERDDRAAAQRMTDAIGVVLGAVAPVLLTAAIGYLWIRSGRRFDGATVTPLVAEIGTPVLIVATLAKTHVAADAFAATALATVLALVTFAAIGIVVLRLARLPLRTYLPSLAFPNAGNLGLPLALYGFGQEGLGFAIVFFAICSIGQFTIGQAIAAGTADFRAILRMPLIYAVALGMVLSVYEVQLPIWVGNSLGVLAGVAVPLMLLMLGASLARLRVASLGRAFVLSLLRISIGAIVGLAVTRLLGITGTARSVFILQSAMPVAVYCYLFAERWKNDPEEVAGLVVVSTVVSVVTIPTLLDLLLTL
jgi:malate permease and related proteins